MKLYCIFSRKIAATNIIASVFPFLYFFLRLSVYKSPLLLFFTDKRCKRVLFYYFWSHIIFNLSINLLSKKKKRGEKGRIYCKNGVGKGGVLSLNYGLWNRQGPHWPCPPPWIHHCIFLSFFLYHLIQDVKLSYVRILLVFIFQTQDKRDSNHPDLIRRSWESRTQMWSSISHVARQWFS